MDAPEDDDEEGAEGTEGLEEKGAKLAELDALDGLEEDRDAAVARLAELLSDSDVDVRAGAAQAVFHYPGATALVERVLDLSRTDPSSPVRAKCLGALGRVLYEGDVAGAGEPGYAPDPELGEPSAATFETVREHLVRVARDGTRSLDERRAALEGLGFVGSDPDVRAVIESFYAMPERAAKVSAVFAIGRSGARELGGKVLEALDSEDREVKLQAIWAAGEGEVEEALPKLVPLAESGRTDERLAAIGALGQIGGETAAQSLLDLSENEPDEEVRGAAAVALEEIALADPDAAAAEE